MRIRAALVNDQNALAADSKTAVASGSYREPERRPLLHTCALLSCVIDRALFSHEAAADHVVSGSWLMSKLMQATLATFSLAPIVPLG